MVIDLSRKPVFVNTDVCNGWFVIRTASDGSVDGLLRRRLEKNEHRRGRKEKHAGNSSTFVEPEAKMVHKEKTFFETRLPVDHILRRQKDEPLPNPFEVATSYRDVFTQRWGSWRAQILIERWQNKQGELWVVTVRDEVTRTDLVTLTMKEIQKEVATGIGTHNDDLLPLERITALRAQPKRQTVWDRLRTPPVPELDLEDFDEAPSS